MNRCGPWSRLGAALVGGALMTYVVAAFEARYLTDGGVPFGTALLAVTTLLAPLSIYLAGLLGGLALMVHPRGPAAPTGLLRWARAGRGDAREERSLTILLAGPATVVFLLVVGRGGLVALSRAPAPAAAATTLGALVLGVGLWCVASVLLAARWLRTRRFAPDGATSLVASLVLVLGVLTVLVAAGTPAGTGTPFALFGVFKRPELDLRAPTLVVLLMLGAYAAPAALWRLPVWASGAVAGLSLLPVLAATSLVDGPVAVAMDRHGAISRPLVAAARKLTDRDGDGASAAFGGGDCDDGDRTIHPAADDVPGNGIDEDCTGRDARPLVLNPASSASRPSAAPGAKPRRLELPKHPGVLLITVDTLRWDLGYRGYARNITPNIDRLANRSVRFDNAYALASYTAKSLPPMLIGKYMSQTHSQKSHFNRFGKRDIFVAERLQDAGVHTVSVQGYWYFFLKGVGFERGFDVIDREAAPSGFGIEGGDDEFNSGELTNRAIAQLQELEKKDEPYFLWVHYIDPHAAYVRHEGHDFGKQERDRYDSEVAFVDHHVGRLLEELATGPLAARTSVVLTSDHGEAFGEHGMRRHGLEVWEPLVRVPLLIRAPGVEPKVVTARRSLIDLVPTVLDLLKVETRPTGGDDFLAGRSLVPDLLAPPGKEPPPRLVFVDMSEGPNNQERQALYDGHLKLIASKGVPMGLYDLGADPHEEKNLIGKANMAPIVQPIVERYKGFRRLLRERPTPAASAATTAPVPSGSSSTKAPAPAASAATTAPARPSARPGTSAPAPGSSAAVP